MAIRAGTPLRFFASFVNICCLMLLIELLVKMSWMERILSNR
jgi:hypothetical protein